MASVLNTRIRVGCAGWSIPRSTAAIFPDEGSHLERYAGRLNAVEINTSFYRPHRPATYARWAASVPEDFAFSVKMPKLITHERRLSNVSEPLKQFLNEAGTLGKRLGCILVQLPPTLEFALPIAAAFFKQLRDLYAGPLACEPRHATWFSHAAQELLSDNSVARVAADPPLHSGGDEPAALTTFHYFRLHGSPQIYYSRYSDEFIDALAHKFEVMPVGAETWCIFDNTAAGHATDNALKLLSMIDQSGSSHRP